MQIYEQLSAKKLCFLQVLLSILRFCTLFPVSTIAGLSLGLQISNPCFELVDGCTPEAVSRLQSMKTLHATAVTPS